MAVVKVSAILLLAIVCNAAAVEIRCASRARNWCGIHEKVTVSDADKITIANTEPKESVTVFSWNLPTNIKTMQSVWFDAFPNLQHCDLSGTGLETITESSFQNARMLKRINLERNNIRVIPASVFKLASNISVVDLDDNRIDEVQDFAFKGLDKLNTVFMSNNNIKTVTRNMLAGAPNLQYVYLSNNDIETIEESALEIPHLRELHIKINHIKKIPDKVLNGAPQLYHLDLSYNLLTTIPDALFQKSKISNLVLDYNELDTVNIKDFLKIPSLNFLSLEDTGVKIEASTDKTPSTSMISQLDLSNNGINDTNVMKQLAIFPDLYTVTLKKNQLEQLDLKNIKDTLESISVIELEQNPIDCKWLKEWLPKMTDIDVDLKTGDWNEDLPDTEQQEHVGDNLCGKLVM